LLGFWLLRHRPRARTIVAIVAATTPFVIRLIIQLGGLPESWALPNESRWLYGGYSSILIGCLLAIALNERAWFERLAPILRRPLPIFVAFAICIVGLREWWWAQGLYPWVSGAVVGCVAISEARTVGWLHNRALRMTGTLSYGIYLFHVLVLAFITQAVGFTPAERPLNPVPLVLCAAISFPVAYLLHVVIERPAIAAGRRRASASSLPLDPAANPP
jgi:peptidoglycan/LPS O-acetylase OafA/YrhL